MALMQGTRSLGAQTLLTHADVTITGAAAAAMVVAANASRGTLIIGNGAAVCRIGDSNTAATRGIALAINATISIDTTDALYVYSASGTTISVMETIRP